MNTAKLVSNTIDQMPAGQPFTTKNFLGLGPRANIDQALSRLARSGKIKRLAWGIFVRPQENPYIGTIMPEPNKIIEAYAHSMGVTVQVHGAEAARVFGLSTQAPTQPIYYTSGPSRQFKVGKLNFILKHVSPKKLAYAGTKVGLAIAALWFLGKGQINATVIATVQNHLTSSEKESLHLAIPAMPGWMSKAFYEYQRNNPCKTP